MNIINTNTKKYPVTADDLAIEYPHTAFPVNLTAESLVGTVFAVVVDVAPPVLAAGETLIELPPAMTNGQYTQRWQVAQISGSPVTLDQALAAMGQAIDLKRDVLIAAGMPYVFPDSLHGTVQLRNDRDRTSVNAVATAGTVMMLAGDTVSAVSFRDDENVTHALSGTQAAQFGIAVLGWISKRYDSAWSHKDALAAMAARPGATAAQIMGYDFSGGWAG